MRPSSAHAGSSGTTGRRPSRAVRDARHDVSAHLARRRPAHDIASATVAKRPMVSSVFCVGVRSCSDALSRERVGRGAIQRCSTSSVPSCAAVCAAGAAATKKRVSKRFGRPSGVSQWLR